MRTCLIGVVFVLSSWSRALHAQEPVEKVPDVVSWVTAAVNPTRAVIHALQSEDKACRLGQLAIAEALGNGAAFTMKRLIVSPRPCAGCDARGMPSAHAMNAVIGISSGWRVGLWFSVGTAEERHRANRHTPWQVLAGAAIGGLSEWAGQSLVRCR